MPDRHPTRPSTAGIALLVLLSTAVAGTPAGASVLERVSIADDDVTQANGGTGPGAISGNGRFVAQVSSATNLVAAPVVTVGGQIYLRDRMLGATELVTIGVGGVEANAGSASFVRSRVGLSADGCLVAFDSMATNLVAAPVLPTVPRTNSVYLRDRCSGGGTTLLSVGVLGTAPNGESGLGGTTISADGRFVAFDSGATNLVPGGSGTLYRYAVGLLDPLMRIPVDGDAPALNGDGHVLAFRSGAPGLVSAPTTTAGRSHVYVRDLAIGVTNTLVSVGFDGSEGNADSAVHRSVGVSLRSPAINEDGQIVAYHSAATNLVVSPGVTPGRVHVYVRNLLTRITQLASVAPDGTTEGNANSGMFANSTVSVSNDGRFVTFDSDATNLVPGGTTGRQVFVRDLVAGVTRVVSVRANGVLGNDHSENSVISGDGRLVAFSSAATNLVPGDTNRVVDGFVGDGTGRYRSEAAFRRDAGRLTRIDFDRDPCGARILAPSPGVLAADRYTRVGVTFAAGVIFEYPGGVLTVSSPNEIANSGINTRTPPGVGPLVVGSFARPVQAVGITNSGAEAVLRLFDADDRLVALLETDGDPDDADFVGLLSLVPVVRFEYDFTGGLGFGGDDLLFSRIMSPDCLAPVLRLPATIIADAVGPAGAPIFYQVTATDRVDPKPVVSCQPPSGSVFPIGATQVGCTAADAAGNLATGQFTVIVGATNDLAALLKAVDALGLPPGITQSLEAKLDRALTALHADRIRPACSSLRAFEGEVQALEGAGQLTPAAAKSLTGPADQLRVVLDCS